MGDLLLRPRVRPAQVPWRCNHRAVAALLVMCVAMALVPAAMAADATPAPAASAWVPWTAAPTPTVASAPVAATTPKPPAPTHTPKAPATTTAKATASAPTTAKATAPTPTTAKATAPAPTTTKATAHTTATAPAPTTAMAKTPVAATSLSAATSAASANTTCDPHYETWNATTARCECQRGFSGLGCRMCARATDCQRAFASPAMTCATGLDYRNASAVKTYDCALDASLQQLFSDGALAVGCDRAARNCSVAVFKRRETVDSDHVIDCALSGCDFPTGGGGGGRCALIECKCGKACSALTKAIVEQSLSGKPAAIKVSNGSALSIDIEGAPLPLSATCTASACEHVPSGGGSGSGSGSGSGGGDSGHGGGGGLLLALVASGALALLLALGVCCGSCCVSVRHGKQLSVAQIDREIAALAATSGRVLEFARVNGRVVDARTLETKRILSDLSGYAQRGQVLGLLGPSGSGKTSLLNALAAVENGKCQLTGEVRVDGKPIGRNYRRVAAYVQQDDALFATLSVRESLQYSAQLRLPARVPAVVKREMVSRILVELNLAHVEHARIGSSGGAGDSAARGISGGERRRVSIGMELVTSPQILFLDEPTSGLDSSSANAVVQLVKELASHGRIVVMSIHQPSAKAFMLLDQVMLLAKGKMLYHGSPQRAKRHFEAIGFKCPENENVADFILDVASDVKNIPMVRAAFKAKHGDKTPMKTVPLTPGTPAEEQPQLQSYYSSRSSISSESSPFMDAEGDALDTPRVHEMLNMPGTPGTPASLRSPSSPPGLGSPDRIQLPSSLGANSPHSTTPPSRSHWIELRVIFQRTARNIFRHRSLLFLHLALSVTLALFGGLIFNHVTNDLAGFQNRSGAFYFILTFFGFASMSSMDLFIAERGIFLRETGAMYYGAFSYFITKAVLDTLLLRVLPAAMFASIFYWIMGLQATLAHFTMFQTTLVLFNVAAGSISILVGVLSRNVGTANLSATVVFLVMLLFGGFLLNAQTMPKSVGWLKHFSIFSYAFEILMTNELKGLLMKFDAPGYPSVPVYGDVFLKTLGMDYANRYYDLVALAMIAGALQVLAFLFLSLQVPVRQELVDESYDDDDNAASKGRSATMQVEVDEVKLADLKKRSPVSKADPEDSKEPDAGTDGDVV